MLRTYMNIMPIILKTYQTQNFCKQKIKQNPTSLNQLKTKYEMFIGLCQSTWLKTISKTIKRTLDLDGFTGKFY